MTVHIPDARDLNPDDLRPTQALRESNGLLDDHDALNARYEGDGYLFFRGVLDPASVTEARRRMLAPLLAAGLAVEEGERARWTGGDAVPPGEEDPVFSGVSETLVRHPANMAVFEKILGEPAITVPMVQYRAYRPNGKLGGVHQDGFYSPGILGYRPLWLPLTPMDAEMGGLVLAPGRTKSGFFHNAAKPPRCPIPEGVIPDDGWARADYRPGDLLVIHPLTPHVGLPNRSAYVRFSIDTRVQSAARPSTVMGSLAAVDEEVVSLACQDGAVRRLRYGPDTFLRIGENLSVRMSPAEFRAQARSGMPLLASIEGDQALMIRRAHAG